MRNRQRFGKKMFAETNGYEEHLPKKGKGQESRVRRKEIPKRGCGDFWGHLDDIQMTLAYEPGTHAVV